MKDKLQTGQEVLGIVQNRLAQRRKETLPAALRFPLEPTGISLKQGFLNKSTVVQSGPRLLVVRIPNEPAREGMETQIASEFAGKGFLQNPTNSFTLRSVQEQQLFSRHLQTAGINTPPVYFAEDGLFVTEYIPATTTLADLWVKNDPLAMEATKNTLRSVISMHSLGLVAGDRWGPNEIVSPDGTVHLIDFDVSMKGQEAREFELANLLYFTSFFAQVGNPDNIEHVWNLYHFLLRHPVLDDIYNKRTLTNYLSTLPRFFASEKCSGPASQFRWSDPEKAVSFFDSLHT